MNGGPRAPGGAPPPAGEGWGAAALGPDGDPDALGRLAAWPRVRLASLPTPVIPASRLAGHLGVDGILVKMDAETGFALGGNKVRKLEYVLEPSRIRGVSCLVTAGGPQSNHCRVTAAFAARAGLDCVLVTQGPEPGAPTGNALLHRLFGAEVRVVAERGDRVPAMTEVAAEIERAGGRPLIVPIGASTGLGSLGYARAAVELVDQLDALGGRPERTLVFVATSSCGTLAGLVLGLAVLGRDDVVAVGVSADVSAGDMRATSERIFAEGAGLLGFRGSLPEASLVAIDGQVGGGYGIPTPESSAAIELLGRLEGLVLDPTYTGKAAAGMIDWIGRGLGRPGDRIVFLHTGGHPGLLAR